MPRTTKTTEAPPPPEVTPEVTLPRPSRSAPSAESRAQARRDFIATHMKDIPDAYHSNIGSDPAKFAADEKRLRAALRRSK